MAHEDKFWKRPYLFKFGKGKAGKARKEKARPADRGPIVQVNFMESWRKADWDKAQREAEQYNERYKPKFNPFKAEYNFALKITPDEKARPVRDAKGAVIWKNVQSTCGLYGDVQCPPQDNALYKEWHMWTLAAREAAAKEAEEARVRRAKEEEEYKAREAKRMEEYKRQRAIEQEERSKRHPCFGFPNVAVDADNKGFSLCMETRYVTDKWEKVGCGTCLSMRVVDEDGEVSLE